MNPRSSSSRFTFSTRSVIAGLGIARVVVLASIGAAESAAIPERTTDAVPYVTGGIGADQVEGMAARSAEYDLKVVFALEGSSGTGHRAFLADVGVRIFEATGREILAVDHAGPLLFAKLPPGRYRVESTFGEMLVTQVADVAERRQTRLAFYWPQTVDRRSAARESTTNALGTKPVAPVEPAPSAGSDFPIVADSSDSGGRIDLKINRLWYVGKTTYAALTIRNDARFPLVKVAVQCKGSTRRGESVEEPERTVLSPTETPMPPGTARTATFTFAKGDGEIRSVSCE